MALLSVTVTSCIKIEGVENMVEEIKPTFLNLEYIYSFEEVDLRRHTRNVQGEFTWYETYYSSSKHTIEEVRRFIKRDYKVDLPETIDLDSNSFIALSIGRKLSMLYYFDESRYDTFTGEVFARPVFEREYYPNTIFVYRVNPLPGYSFISNDLFTSDFTQFNVLAHIPFEVWDYDGRMQAGTDLDGVRPFQRDDSNDNWQRRWKELEEPLYGYINAPEVGLMWLPTMKSGMESRLNIGDDFTIYGDVEDGQDIDGSSHWYYVRTSMASGNRIGYIHSSYVTIAIDQ